MHIAKMMKKKKKKNLQHKKGCSIRTAKGPLYPRQQAER